MRRWRVPVLAALGAAHAAVRRLDPAAGRRVVAGRADGYRAWDPEVIGVDTAAERAVIRALRRRGVRGTLLSEEAGQQPLGPGAGRGESVYVVLDPFDGSMMYRQGIRAHWFTALGIYGPDRLPRAAGVIDHVTGEVIVADGGGTARLRRPRGRASSLRPAATKSVDGACLEAYLMKPAFLYPTATALRPLLARARFVLPNGGPGGFVDVACGRIDVYVCWREALTEVFSAVAVAERAGARVSHWDGTPLRFRPDLRALYSLVCSANARLHAAALRALRDVAPPEGVVP
jgi:myo-inositol-1(or 4)-monophosphatase